ncbi:RAMP superfamily CRISPR-associated protein [Actinomyces weissii]|uniref:TIGR03986 family CRISPR-associated RAMP protein n=1 Tax=Actinomyces weissii TaxID=675090 RepID=A0A7T7MA50_9ACTO|nr:RAMP superfamily CRISPR-associated protein [Actinomyces weissii]QQM67643.1 hypothetical protein JG540_01795 [Actinomyces weissii]
MATPTVPGQQAAGSAGLRQVVVASRSGDPLGARSWEDATIPATSLKGMLSSAYEAVTASRMRVFREHDHVLTHRRTTQESTFLYPVLLVPREDGSGLRARVMLGMNPKPRNPHEWNNPRYVCAAVLPDSLYVAANFLEADGMYVFTGSADRSKQRGDRARAEERLTELRAVTPHFKEIDFSVELEHFYSKQKRAIVNKVGNAFFCRSKKDNAEKQFGLRGIVVRTTPQAGQSLIDTKHSEFVFFDKNKQSTFLPVDDGVLNNLVEVLHSYLANIRTLEQQELRRRACGASSDSNTRKSSDPSTWLVDVLDKGKYGAPGRNAGREQILSFLEDLASKLAKHNRGIPLFATVRQGRITELSPSQVGRRADGTAVAPAVLAEEARTRPALRMEEASPGDRLWGFVADGKMDGQDQGAALRGRVRIEAVEPEPSGGSESFLQLPASGSNGWLLPTLASPKPSTGFPYLRRTDGGALDEKTTRAHTFQRGQTLIRKVYPTHRLLRDKQIAAVPGVSNLNGDSGSADTVIGSYLAPGARFRTRIHFDGLEPAELAVLLWLLSPERLVPQSERHTDGGQGIGYHHIGLGKPLGLGAVEVRATRVVRRSSKTIGQGYQSLSSCLGLDGESLDAELESTLSDLPSDFEKSLPVRAFQRAAFGWRSGTVSYPGAGEAANGDLSPIINWFKEREENRVNHKLNGKQLSRKYDLPPLATSAD